MCDYSLEAYRSRPARKGERYVTHRFHSGSVGLAAVGDGSTAVCVTPDMKLRLQGLPNDVQDRFGAGPDEEVTFIRWDGEANCYRDAVRFKNGAEVSLLDLGPGVTAILTAALDQPVPRRLVAAWI